MLAAADIPSAAPSSAEMSDSSDPDRPGIAAALYAVYQWGVFLPLAVLVTAASAVSAFLLATFSGSLASRLVGRRWARTIAALTPMRVRVRGREHVEPQGSYVVVANHQSLYDIFVLYGWLDLDFRWVMKQEVRRIPGVGAACERIGHVFIDRSNPEAARATLETAKSRLGPGVSVLIFPEGTRGPGSELLPFRKGAFHLARELRRPILPVTLVGTDQVLPARSLRLRPGTASLLFHPPVEPPAPDGHDLDACVESVRRLVGAPLAAPTD